MRTFAVLGLGLASAVIASCRDPTAILVDISTDVDCATVSKQKVVLRIGTRDAIRSGLGQTIEATTCAGGEIGTLTVVPSGDESSPVVIAVALGTTSPSSVCTQGAPGCILASRSIGYVDHRTLRLPIKMSKSCIGVPCGVDQTCVAGACVSNEVRACPNDVCDEGALPPSDAGVDGATDGGTMCGGVPVDLASNPAHCGACNFDCTGSNKCVNGVCVLAAANADPLAEIAIDATRVVWTGGKAPVSWVPKTGGAASVVFAPGSGDAVYGLDYSVATTEFRFADNPVASKVAFYAWSGSTATPFLSSNGNADARELIADGTSVIWLDSLTGAMRRDSTEIAFVPNPPCTHIAVTSGSFACLTASGVTSVQKGKNPPILTLATGATYIAGDRTSESVYASMPNAIAKSTSIAFDAFATLVVTPAPSRIYFDTSKKRVIWVGNDSSILEADSTGGNVRVDLASAQGYSQLGDLVADDGAVYFMCKGSPHKVARR